jgi:two-component system NtrC family sensor kinase
MSGAVIRGPDLQSDSGKEQQEAKQAGERSVCIPGGRPRYLAHDARNWLTALRVYCDLLRNPDNTPEDISRLTDELSAAVDRGKTLVMALLDGVPPAGTGGAIACIDLADALRRRFRLLQSMAGPGIQLMLQTPGEPVPVRISEMALERILFNLILNAAEAMPGKGRIVITIERPTSGEDFVHLRVTDNGPGIPHPELPRIFQPGTSSKTSDGQPHGYGLAIVRELTEAAGGEVDVWSGIGAGTSFAVKLRAA